MFDKIDSQNLFDEFLSFNLSLFNQSNHGNASISADSPPDADVWNPTYTPNEWHAICLAEVSFDQSFVSAIADLVSLMASPQATIHHDDNGDGHFRHLAGPFPLAMLTYFSSTIRAQCEGGLNGGAFMLRPSIIHITGGSTGALIDIFNWMQVCCQMGRLEPLSNSLRGSTRHMRGLCAVRKLAVTLLEFEIHHTAMRLQKDLLSTDELTDFGGDLGGFLQEHKDALIGNIARSYTAGCLTDIDRHIGLALAHNGYYKAVSDALKELKEYNWHPYSAQAEASWLRREKLTPPMGQAIPMQPPIPVFTHQQFAHKGSMGQQVPMITPPPHHNVYSYITGPTYWPRPPPISYHHTSASPASHRSHYPPGHRDDLRKPIHIHIHNNGSNLIRTGHSHHHHRRRDDYSDYSSSLPGRHHCRHIRPENCHSLTWDQKTITAADMVDRARTRRPCALDYRPIQSAVDTPRHEPLLTGEKLLNRRQLGNNHYLHVFRDDHGKDRCVSKGPGFRFKTNARNAEKMLTYRCGCWLGADAHRNFRDDGTAIGTHSARYTCNSCIRRDTHYNQYARHR